MSNLTTTDIEKLAHMARLAIDEAHVPIYLSGLSNIIDLISQMEAADTKDIQLVANPFNLSQRLRKDEITEIDERELFQSRAPQTDGGLYLVPKVIE